ncbi:hypothetical protein [Paenibacillus lautus]|nr:hypothetical protein [Paenibacillus lautus]
MGAGHALATCDEEMLEPVDGWGDSVPKFCTLLHVRTVRGPGHAWMAVDR